MEILLKHFLFCLYLTKIVYSFPQQPEINDQYETTQGEETTTTAPKNITDTTVEQNEVLPKRNETVTTVVVASESITTRLCNMITRPILHIIAIPKVNLVLRNIGTCVVNGAMELITFYFPPPLIPLIATAAGMVIPFEPVVMLKEKMPVTSYRRAFRTAMNSFLGTFDKYKLDDEDDDPYMTRRFNRRLMNDSEDKDKSK